MRHYLLLPICMTFAIISGLHAQDKHADAGIYYGCSSNAVGTVEVTMYLENDCTYRIEMGFDFYGQWRSNQDSVWIYTGHWVAFGDWLLFFTEDKEAYPHDEFHFYDPDEYTNLVHEMQLESRARTLKITRAENKPQICFGISWDVFEEAWVNCMVTRLDGAYKSVQFDNQCVPVDSSR